MLSSTKLEVTVNNQTLKWYKSKGYDIPLTKVQLWANKKGERVKNGIDWRVTRGTKIIIDVKDLPPASNQKISAVCKTCGKTYNIKYHDYIRKRTENCKPCVNATLKGDGSHSYWVSKLITTNPDAKCDISGETDKRFLVLHHLHSIKAGGRNTIDNYVVLSANYHLAFHNSLGGMNIPCTKEDYIAFKKQEFNYSN